MPESRNLWQYPSTTASTGIILLLWQYITFFRAYLDTILKAFKCYSWFLLSLLNFIIPMGFGAQSRNGTIPCGQINDQFEHCFFVFFYERRKSCTQNASQLRIFQVFLTVNSGYFLLSLMPFLIFHFINVPLIQFKSWNGTIPCGQINDKFEHCFLFSFMREENRIRRIGVSNEWATKSPQIQSPRFLKSLWGVFLLGQYTP